MHSHIQDTFGLGVAHMTSDACERCTSLARQTMQESEKNGERIEITAHNDGTRADRGQFTFSHASGTPAVRQRYASGTPAVRRRCTHGTPTEHAPYTFSHVSGTPAVRLRYACGTRAGPPTEHRLVTSAVRQRYGGGYVYHHTCSGPVGHASGHASGRSSRHCTGHVFGRCIGHASGHTSGHVSRHCTGHVFGHCIGHTSVHASGHSSRHCTGHVFGHCIGHTRQHYIRYVVQPVVVTHTEREQTLGACALKNGPLL